MAKMLAALVAFVAAVAVEAAVPSIDSSSIRLSQDPQTRLVTITYDLDNAAAVVVADIRVGGKAMSGTDLAALSGDVNMRVAEGSDRKILWRPEVDVEPGALEVSLSAYSVFNPPDYMVIDCTITNAPVRFYTSSEMLPYEGGVTNPLCKTELLVMRKIPARNVTWTMGNPSATSGYTKPHKVTLSDNYYMGVYEVSILQAYMLSSLANSTTIDGRGEALQKGTTHNGNPSQLRGTLTDEWRGWPQEGHSVREGSLIWKFRQKTPVELDLPTSAQWEYAARAGVPGRYTDGSTTTGIAALNLLAWFDKNEPSTSGFHPVGQKRPNRWGLYDVLGNVYEQCLDWYEGVAMPDATDPTGPDNAGKTLASRVYRSFSVANNYDQLTLDGVIGLYDGRGYRLCAPCYAPGAGTDGEEGEGEPLGEKTMEWLDPVRIVFVGDQVIKRAQTESSGFVQQMRSAFSATYSNRVTTVVAIGHDSGYVDYWRSTIEPNSRTAPYTSGMSADPYAELNGNPDPDWLIFGFGSMEIDCPYYGISSLSTWKSRVKELIDTIAARCTPKKIGIMGATPVTEDRESPKNAAVDAFSEAAREICDENGYTFFPVTDDIWKTFDRGRRLRNDFRITDAFVRPSAVGHYSIAQSILNELGETNAANWIVEQRIDPYFWEYRSRTAALSLRMLSADDAGDGRFTFTLAYDYTAADGSTNEVPVLTSVTVPEGWTLVSAANGRVVATGAPDRLYNDVAVAAQGLSATCRIPAPWKVVAGVPFPGSCWDGLSTFIKANADAYEKGSIDYAGHEWKTCFSTPDYFGYGSNSVNFAQLEYLNFYSGGFGKRRVYSAKERDVTVSLGRGSGVTCYVQSMVYVNGTEVLDQYLGSSAGPFTATVHLNAGWNEIGFRSVHRTWGHQLYVGIDPVDAEDDFSDIRYALP